MGTPAKRQMGDLKQIKTAFLGCIASDPDGPVDQDLAPD